MKKHSYLQLARRTSTSAQRDLASLIREIDIACLRDREYIERLIEEVRGATFELSDLMELYYQDEGTSPAEANLEALGGDGGGDGVRDGILYKHQRTTSLGEGEEKGIIVEPEDGY